MLPKLLDEKGKKKAQEQQKVLPEVGIAKSVYNGCVKDSTPVPYWPQFDVSRKG